MRKFVLIAALLVLPLTGVSVDRQIKGANVTDTDITADSLLKEADSVFQKRDYNTAKEKYEKVVEAAHKEFNRSVEVEALAQVARTNLILGEKENGRAWLEKAEERASDSDPYGWSRLLGVKGRFAWQDKDLTTARTIFEEMFAYCNTNGLYGRAIDAAHMVAIVAEKPEEQIEWNRLGIEAAEASDTEHWLGPLWNNLAGTYYDLNQFDSALTCYRKAREYHWRFSGEIGKLYADYHVGMTLRLTGQTEEAAQWLRPVLAWAERLGNHSCIGQACEDLGEIAITDGNSEEGLALLKRAREEYKLEGYDSSWPEIYEKIEKRIAELGG